jgi:hypothetical protein
VEKSMAESHKINDAIKILLKHHMTQ